MQAARNDVMNEAVYHPEDVLALTEQLLPQFTGIADAAPHHDFRINGQALPREPHRYSGRTAMLSNLAVSEPKPKQDDDSPFTFTMEGYPGMPPSPLIPFFWSPGWNSIQAVNKYQQEPGGALKNEKAGKLLFAYRKDVTPAYFKDIPEAYVVRNDRWLLFPQYHVFGSEELSAYSKGIRELTPEPYVALSANDAARLGLTNAQTITIRVFEQAYELPVTIDRSLPNGLLLIPAGLPGMPVMNWNSYVSLIKY